MSVAFETDPFMHGNPELVLEETFLTSGPFGAIYDVFPDGKRFLKIKEGAPGDEADPTQVILVQNWTEELKRLVPVDD